GQHLADPTWVGELEQASGASPGDRAIQTFLRLVGGGNVRSLDGVVRVPKGVPVARPDGSCAVVIRVTSVVEADRPALECVVQRARLLMNGKVLVLGGRPLRRRVPGEPAVARQLRAGRCQVAGTGRSHGYPLSR